MLPISLLAYDIYVKPRLAHYAQFFITNKLSFDDNDYDC